MADNRSWPERVVSALVAVLGLGIDSITLSPKLVFPYSAMRGTLGEVARELAKGTEVPEEFIYVAALTCLGSMVSGRLTLNLGLDSDTRLYTVLLGTSYDVRKSTAMKKTLQFFQSLESASPLSVSHGVASAEGLLETLKESQRTLLAYDELRAFFDKTRIEASTLLPMVTSLFEQHDWDNRSKQKALSVRDARLSFLGCCTTDTYERVFSSEAIAIGFPNRLFIVNADSKPRIAWPGKPDGAKLAELRRGLQAQLAKLPATVDATPEAKAEWEEWYKNLPASEHAKRLDTIGFRLMPLLAFSGGKETIDVEVIRDVIEILRYELRIRKVSDPIDADNSIAKMEQSIVRQLENRGPMSERDLRKYTNAHTKGQGIFQLSLRNLTGVDIRLEEKKWALINEVEEAP
jgi:hypothetical protein